MKLFKMKYFQDVLPELIQTALADGKINIIKAQAIINNRGLIDNQPSVFFNAEEIKSLTKLIESCITTAALNRGLYFKASKELALISGAGIAGLSASFELLAKGYKVLIAEKRNAFDRFNVINLDVEAQRFLKKFGLLEEFERSIAARIKTHQYVLLGKEGMQNLGISDVSQLQSSNLPFEPEFFNQLFNNDGIYSVKIKDLQAFLAKKALESGAHLLGNVEEKVAAFTQEGGVSKIQITGKGNSSHPMMLEPDLFFIAEGAHSTTAEQLGMTMKDIKNECSGENWIFGNVKYLGKETFVVSMIDVSGNNLEIANIIFNAKIHEVNIAVTSKKHLSQELIQERILGIVQRVFSFLNIEEIPQSLIAFVQHPVEVSNKKRDIYSRDNVFCIGDAAGYSSPLAGMGGTLGLTLIPRTIEQLVSDTERKSSKRHDHFRLFSDGYTSRWIAKSQSVKKHCLSLFNSKEQTLSKVDEQALKSAVPK